LVSRSFYQHVNLPIITLPYITGQRYNNEVNQLINTTHGRHGDKLERKVLGYGQATFREVRGLCTCILFAVEY